MKEIFTWEVNDLENYNDDFEYNGVNFNKIYEMSHHKICVRLQLLLEKFTTYRAMRDLYTIKFEPENKRGTFGSYYNYTITLIEKRGDSKSLITRHMTKTDINEFDNIVNIPTLIYAFMHELGHLFTMTKMEDIRIYTKNMRVSPDLDDMETYLSNPYEQMANEIAYTLISENLELIYTALFKVEDSKEIKKELDLINPIIPDTESIKNKYLKRI